MAWMNDDEIEEFLLRAAPGLRIMFVMTGADIEGAKRWIDTMRTLASRHVNKL